MGGAKIDVAKDFRDLLRAFVDHDVRFLIVGAYALAVLGRPRATGDLDVWVDPTPENADRAYAALRIDVLTQISGVDFATAWPRRQEALFDDVQVAVLGRDDFIANKRATGRLKDLADAE